MNKTELAAALAAKVGMTKKDAKIVLTGFSELIGEILRNEDTLAISGIGKFKKVHKNEYTARNPKTGAAVVVPAHDKVKFAISKTLVDYINTK